jgi:hypothetical protein
MRSSCTWARWRRGRGALRRPGRSMRGVVMGYMFLLVFPFSFIYFLFRTSSFVVFFSYEEEKEEAVRAYEDRIQELEDENGELADEVATLNGELFAFSLLFFVFLLEKKYRCRGICICALLFYFFLLFNLPFYVFREEIRMRYEESLAEGLK